jgi:outer membrane protein W
MRKLVPVLLLLAVSASAQTIDKPTRVSFFVTNPGLGNDGDGGVLDGGVGLALEHRFSRKWSAAIDVAREVHDYQPRFFDPTTIEFRTYPVDVLARYSFQSAHTRWRPYMGAGVRYVSAPDAPSGAKYDDEVWPELAGGVELNAAESWSLLFEAKGLVVNDIPEYDELLKVSIGFGWRF